MVPIVDQFEGDENCLFINVYTPSSPASKALPVMVWIHGGGLSVGSSLDDNPNLFVKHTGAIVVNFNYRLGALGFLADAALGHQNPLDSTGNYGIEDQQAALRWVQSNIAAFGGNPRNVTVAGESAGGISVCAQLMSPQSRGLFARAIMESGPCDIALPSTTTAEQQGARIAAAAGCSNVADEAACLRSRSVQQILAAAPSDPTFLFGEGVQWSPVIDGREFPATWNVLLARGQFQHVPVLLGSNHDEGTLFIPVAFTLQGKTVTPAVEDAALLHFFKNQGIVNKVLARYPASTYGSPARALGEAMGDALLACPSIDAAGPLARRVPTYLYAFNYPKTQFVAQPPGFSMGAFHGSELRYLFGHNEQLDAQQPFTSNDERLSRAMQGYWGSFVTRGVPAAVGQPSWPRDDGSGKFLALNSVISTGKGDRTPTCAFWQFLNWEKYAAGPTVGAL